VFGRPERGGVLEKAGWWIGRISNDFELISNRYGGECMHDAFP
jgi:hypothetical protein